MNDQKTACIDGIYCSASLSENQRGFLSFVILVGDHQTLWIEINGNRLLGFRQHDMIFPTGLTSCLENPRTIKRFNDTLHTSFFKHDIYHKINYIHVRDSYPPSTHLAQPFQKLD